MSNYRISATVSSAPRGNAREWVDMNCSICGDLKRAFTATFEEYRVARSSACYRVTTEFAAQKNVDMERARYELEEHQLVCVALVSSIAPLPEQHVAARLRQLAA